MNATIPTDETVSDEMAIDGFLSPMLHDYIPNIIEAHPAWFDFARRLNRRIVSMWLQHPITTEGLLPLEHRGDRPQARLRLSCGPTLGDSVRRVHRGGRLWRPPDADGRVLRPFEQVRVRDAELTANQI